MRPRKTWHEKLHDAKDLPKVVRIDGRMRKQWGSGTVAIPAPVEVDALMRRVRKGRVVTIAELRAAVARKHGATIGCPITTGIFAWLAAHAAAEAQAQGRKRVTAWWRTLKTGGELNAKYPGGLAAQRELLEDEGHEVVARGARWFVRGFEQRLARL
jgi:hypothetical protein